MTNKRLEKSKSYHKDWLESRGLSRKQIRAKRDPNVQPVSFPDLSTYHKVPLGNGFAKSGFKDTIMERRYKESPEVRAEIERKATRIAPAYSKGNAQYISDGDDPKNLGKKL